MLFMNYLPSRDLRRELSLTIEVGKSRWCKKVKTAYKKERNEKTRKIVRCVETRCREKIEDGKHSRKRKKWKRPGKQPRRPQRPRSHPVTARYSGTSPNLLYELFLFYSLVFRSPDLSLYRTSVWPLNSHHHS